MNDKIICLVGESGSGKTTIAELLEKEGYNYIESYTTRPPRFQGERGHIFISDKEYLEHVTSTDEDGTLAFKDSNMIAYTSYNNSRYFATRAQYKNKGTSIYIVDVDGVKRLKEKTTDAEIIVVYLKADADLRINRLILQRGIIEAQKRVLYDKNKFRLINSDYVIDTNRSIEEVLELVKRVVGGLE